MLILSNRVSFLDIYYLLPFFELGSPQPHPNGRGTIYCPKKDIYYLSLEFDLKYHHAFQQLNWFDKMHRFISGIL
jgi:hypothetical protein